MAGRTAAGRKAARVTAGRGPVIEFACEAALPAIEDAGIVDPDGAAVAREVRSHPGPGRFRAIALQPTQGLSGG